MSGRTAAMHPSNTAEVAKLLREASAGGDAVEVVGGGTKTGWGLRSGADAVVLSTSALSDGFSHAAADQTAVVSAGMRLGELQERLSAEGQWLAIDPPDRSLRATVGGVFCADDAGPRRIRYGTMRDLVIGATFVLADGTVAHTGGRVIKNVAGFDLAKLLCGSLGTLAVVTELVLRLHPLPQSSTTLMCAASPAEVPVLADRLARCPAEASAVGWSAGMLCVRVEGRAEGLPKRADQLAAVLAAADSGAASVESVSGSDEEDLWDALAEARRPSPSELACRVVTRPQQFAELHHWASAAAGEARVDLEIVSDPCIGIHDVRFGPPLVSATGALVSLRRALGGIGGTAVVRGTVEGIEPGTLWGPAPPAAGVMAAVKRALDPGLVLAPERFSSWW